MKILPMFHYSLVDRGVLFFRDLRELGELVGVVFPQSGHSKCDGEMYIEERSPDIALF